MFPSERNPPVRVDRALNGITLDDLIKVNANERSLGGRVSPSCSSSDSDDSPVRSAAALGRSASLRELHKDDRKLGKGSFGEVLCVRISQDPSGRLYALKSLRKRDVEQGQLAGQVEREISVQSRLPAHPNILSLYSHFEDRRYVYLLLEYCAKGELYHLLRTQPKRKFPVEKAVKYFVMAAKAVGHLHSHGIIHRDIKPENLLVTADDTLKLADFGWCAELPPARPGLTHVKRRTFCGTLDYLSPEMLLGRGHDHSIDLWGLGILLYELLAGRPPFNATDQRTVVSNIINVKLSFPSDFPLVAEDLVRRLLVRDEGRRLTISEVLDHPLCTSMGVASTARPSPPPVMATPQLRHRVLDLTRHQQQPTGLARVPTLRTLHQQQQPPASTARELPQYLHRSFAQSPIIHSCLDTSTVSQVSAVMSPSVHYRPLPSGNISVCYPPAAPPPPQRSASAQKPPSSGTPVTVRVTNQHHKPGSGPRLPNKPDLTAGLPSLHESFLGYHPPNQHQTGHYIRRLQSPLQSVRDTDGSSFLVFDESSLLSLDDSMCITQKPCVVAAPPAVAPRQVSVAAATRSPTGPPPQPIMFANWPPLTAPNLLAQQPPPRIGLYNPPGFIRHH